MGYNATGFVYMQAENLDELVKSCTSLMRLCPDVGSMDIFDGEARKRGTLSREVVYHPQSRSIGNAAPDAPGVSFSPGA